VSDIQLVVQGDDLGMCHAVNEGIQCAFEDGIVTQSVAMAPCSWIDEGARFAKSSGIHLGMHCTLTSEWQYLRWRPLSDGASLSESDGTFHRLLATAIEKLDAAEAATELDAQHARLLQLGLQPAYFDFHMGPASPSAFAHVVEKHERPFLYPFASSHYSFESLQMLSPHAADAKLRWMLDYLDALGPGNHFLCTHPGVASPELSAMTPREAANACWMDEYRVSDLAVLTSSQVRDRLGERGIELITVAELSPIDASSDRRGGPD
jgi:predicted glycoside hydrolase/deacetylase ChbG (UPF0249 family)